MESSIFDKASLRIAVIFHRFGPYHEARIRAAASLIGLLAIQGCRRDKTYAWDEIEHGTTCPHETLIYHGDSDQHRTIVLRHRLASVLDRKAPVAAVIPGWSGSLASAAIEWCLVNCRPVVVMSESAEWDQPRMWWKEWIKRRVVGLCSAALVGGRSHADYMAKLGMPRNRIFLGYDAVDNDYFAGKAKEVRGQRSEVRKKHHLPENYFLASARFIEKKNLFRLLQGYARYRQLAVDHRPQTTDHGPGTAGGGPWDLVLLGDGELRPALNSQLSTLNLHGHVQMPGFKQYLDLPAYYGLANCFVHASTTEQWGLVVNEAMASGLPVLVSNQCGCAPDLVQEGVNGFTLDPTNVDQLAGLMLKVSAFNFPLSSFGDASKRIVSDWGPERFATGLKAAAEKAIEVGPRKAGLLDRILLRLLMLK